MLNAETIDNLAKEVHAINKAVGWWDNENDDTFTTKLQMAITEVCESTEGERKDMMDDHLPHRKMGEVELADAAIRLLDLAVKYYWRFHDFLSYNPNIADDMDIASCHFFIIQDIVNIHINESKETIYYSQALCSIFKTGEMMGYDIMSAMREKIEYNKAREDHKRHARAAKGGKKF